MKLFAITMLTLVVCLNTYSATKAAIHAVNDSNKNVTIALDSKGKPRVDADPRTYPTIKDFREGYDYSAFCYKGTLTDTRELLTALVDSADGDGDSWAELKSISTNRKKQIKVVVSIIDESGKNNESYIFSACK